MEDSSARAIFPQKIAPFPNSTQVERFMLLLVPSDRKIHPKGQDLITIPFLSKCVARFIHAIILQCQKCHFFVLNRVRVLKTSAAHSLYPNSPLVYLQYKKQNYITPGGCSEGVTGKRRESLKTFMLKNGHCHFWR